MKYPILHSHCLNITYARLVHIYLLNEKNILKKCKRHQNPTRNGKVRLRTEVSCSKGWCQMKVAYMRSTTYFRKLSHEVFPYIFIALLQGMSPTYQHAGFIIITEIVKINSQSSLSHEV